MKFVIPFSVILLSVFFYNGDFYISKWALWQVMGAVYLGHEISKRYGYLAGLCFVWPIFGAVLAYDGQVPITMQNANKVISVENVILRATVCWIITVLVISRLTYFSHRRLETCFAWFCIADSLFVLGQWLFRVPPDAMNGFIGVNSSLNGCMIAVTSCFLLFDEFVLIIPLAAIIASGNSVPMGVFAVVCGSYLVAERKTKIAIPMIIGLLLLGYWLIPNFFFDSARFKIWHITLDWWNQINAPYLLGSGNGTFFIIGPMLQRYYNVGVTELFIWAHNDWLQTFIEQGIIGLGLFICLFIKCLKQSFRKPYLFSGMMGYGACSFFNFPAHHALFAIVGVLFVVRCLDGQVFKNL